ncbi:MAG: alkene reductase [Ferrovibrionaceae bacterium]
MSALRLFSPLRLGPHRLAHRVVMAPLTRARAVQPGNVPGPLNAEYYAQRAGKGGMIIAEASQVRADGQGFPQTPGIHSAEQVAGWRLVTDAIHARGGIVYLQLWHVGRISHSSLQPDGGLPVAPSAIALEGKTFTRDWQLAPFETPRALTAGEIAGVVEDYAQAARLAEQAGFDGVEIHAANGYLIEQFLQSRSNQRTDGYGGSIENRTRLLREITDAVAGVWGADRVGVRLSPWGIANGSGEDDPIPLYTHAIEALAARRLGYLHLIEPRASGTGKADLHRPEQPSATATFRSRWPGVLIGAGGYDRDGAIEAVERGTADAVAFGRAFIANPDLPLRLERGAPLNPYDRPTFYGGTEKGYTDYPALETEAA